MTEPRPMAPEDCLRSLREGHTLPTLAGHVRLAVPLLEVVEDLADAEQAHRDDDEVDAVGELQAVEGEAGGAGEAVAADGGQQQADRRGDQRLELVAAADGGDQQDAEQRQRGVLGRAEVQREARPRPGASSVSPMIEMVAPTKEPMAAMPSAVPALPCLASAKPSNTVTTERRLAGEAQQHRGDGAAVLGAVVDAGEHDDRRDRVDACR